MINNSQENSEAAETLNADSTVKRLDSVNLAVAIIITQIVAYLCEKGFASIDFKKLFEEMVVFTNGLEAKIALENDKIKISFIKVVDETGIISQILMQAGGLVSILETAFMESVIKKAEIAVLPIKRETTDLIKFRIEDQNIIFDFTNLNKVLIA